MYSEQGFGELSEPSWAREEKVIRKKLVSKTAYSGPRLPPIPAKVATPRGKFSTPDSDQTCHLLPGLAAV